MDEADKRAEDLARDAVDAVGAKEIVADARRTARDMRYRCDKYETATENTRAYKSNGQGQA